jgi:hypothetical protein
MTQPKVTDTLTWDRDALVLQGLDREDRSVGGIAVISASSAVELLGGLSVGVKDGRVGTESLVPSNEGRLLVEVSVEEVGFINVALDLHEDDGRDVLLLVGDDLRGEASDSCALDPGIDVVGSLDSLAPSEVLPLLLGVEALAHVVDLDVVDERRQCRLRKLSLHKALALLRVERWCTLHIYY